MLFDADCGFCARTAGLVPRLRADVEIASIQETDLAAYGIDARRALVEMPFVGADGAVAYGHRAWAQVLRATPWPLRWLGAALGSPAAAPLASRVYGWVAANRARLPGGTPACELGDRTGAPPPAGGAQPAQASSQPSTEDAGREAGPA